MTDNLEPIPPAEESPLYRALGITPSFDDNADAPPVDVDKLRRYYRGELDTIARQEVRNLVGTFRSWYSALGEVVRDRGRSET